VLCHTINAEVNKRATLPGEVPVPDAQGIFKWSETDEGKRWCGAEGELEGKVITQRTIHHLKRIFRSVMKKDFEGVPAMRTTYSVMSCGQKGRVMFARFSCYCVPCLQDDNENCESPEALGEWEPHDFQ
jgi:hypothetical protein